MRKQNVLDGSPGILAVLQNNHGSMDRSTVSLYSFRLMDLAVELQKAVPSYMDEPDDHTIHPHLLTLPYFRNT